MKYFDIFEIVVLFYTTCNLIFVNLITCFLLFYYSPEKEKVTECTLIYRISEGSLKKLKKQITRHKLNVIL